MGGKDKKGGTRNGRVSPHGSEELDSLVEDGSDRPCRQQLTTPRFSWRCKGWCCFLGLVAMSAAALSTCQVSFDGTLTAVCYLDPRKGHTVHAGIAPLRSLPDYGRKGPLVLKKGAAGTILVTGGAGFVGFHLTQRLAKDGFKVVVIDDFNPYYSPALKRDRAAQLTSAHPGLVTVLDQDLCDGDKLEKLIDNEQVTHVVSLAAQAGVRYSLQQPAAYMRANVRCFLSLLEVLRDRRAVKLVYASSSSVYGANKEAPFSESQRVDTPNSLYAATKKSNEAFALVYHKLYNISATGLRFFTVYGPWGRPDMAYFSFAHKMTKGEPIAVYGHGKPSRDFTYVDDIVTGLVGCLALGAPYEVFNLGNNEPVNLLTFIKTLERELDLKATLNMTDMAPGDVLSTHADVSRAKRLLGYQPTTSLDVGLREFAKWFKGPEYKERYATEGLWRTGKGWNRYADAVERTRGLK